MKLDDWQMIISIEFLARFYLQPAYMYVCQTLEIYCERMMVPCLLCNNASTLFLFKLIPTEQVAAASEEGHLLVSLSLILPIVFLTQNQYKVKFISI